MKQNNVVVTSLYHSGIKLKISCLPLSFNQIMYLFSTNGIVLNFLVSVRYIAKTLYGEDEEEVTPQNNNSVEEPKLLGLHPVSNEKVASTA